ncbi:uncharacterized protein LAJ45_00938 [Morchella importuna]|uniref:uncharacterized protein n=1 Tax=Morchella importuna TaxID=1174673 RepID=UPI001E8DC4C8|nr:uncharacterized protein LAJ45_00938 [Morchella importuna]KAH8154411.1 hypothetical protein LAJ45_00938 [Morchella importuna]
MSAPNTPNSSQTTAPPNSPISGNPIAIPDRLRAAIEAKNARKTADQVEIETEEIARGIRRLMSRASIESLKPETAESTAILMRPARPGQGIRDPEAVNIPARLVRKIELDTLREELEWVRTESEWHQATASGELPEGTGWYSDDGDEHADPMDNDSLALGEDGASSPATGTDRIRRRDRIRHAGEVLLRRMSSLNPRTTRAPEKN